MEQTVKRTRQSKKNVAVSIISKLILTLFPFVVRTILIQKLGIEYLGLNGLFTSVLKTLSLTELGFSSAITFALYRPVAEGDKDLVGKILHFFRSVYRIVGCVILAAGLLITPFLNFFVKDGYPTDINIYILYLIYLLNTAISYFLFAYENSIIIAEMRHDIHTIINTIKSVLLYSSQILLLIIFKNYYVYAVCLPITTIVSNLLTHIFVKKNYHYKVAGKLEKTDRNKILKQVGALVGNKIGAIVFASVDSIVISKFLGLNILGKYDNYYFIITSLSGFVMVMFDSVQSIIGNALVTKTDEENYTIFKKIFSFNAILSIVSTTCLFVCYQTFIRFWVGADNMLDVSIYILLSIYFFCICMRRTVMAYKESAGMWTDDFLKPYISVAVNLSTNILLVYLIGLPGIVISSIISLLFIEIPWETRVFFKKHFAGHFKEYIFDFFAAWAVLIISIATSTSVCKFVMGGLLGFTLKGILSCIISMLIVFVLYKDKINDIKFLIFKRRKK